MSDWFVYIDIILFLNVFFYNIMFFEKFMNYFVEILGFILKGDGNVSYRFIVFMDEDG